ncbi:vanadium-dependent haloperoxidase [Fertoebacter nigrum]|uniref:Vanadium-dependent haloperoxidase n=1 Tax=Fertoeibacter niger TaxID=2656921 RepID=A0A8X8KMK2_9RHOB|nr:vanadium-dependent haloperoxidase [Fertoeibacter niger]NUB44000.1 vanadium-dependent haloperoxidase [Fertoeibacter niger]
MILLSRLCAAFLLALCVWSPGVARAAAPEKVLHDWYRLILELVRHTPTYSPPVASRSFAYLGVTAHEAVAGGSDDLLSLAGQLNGLTTLPERQQGAAYDEAVVLNAALTQAVEAYFGNTGPTGQRAMAAMGTRLRDRVTEGVAPDVVARSIAQGEAVAAHVLAWSADDGGAVIENMGFPQTYTPGAAPESWVPTNATVRQQQAPLLPDWGNNRTFAMPDGKTCPLPPPPAYSEDPASDFYREAMEVVEAKANLTPEHIHIARSWSDDPMLSTTPPGHWVSIARQVLERDNAPFDRQVEVHALLGVGLADSFIGCWDAKFRYDLLRPVTYIRRVIDPAWEPLLITPPFPEYPSGHSTQSGAADVILTALFGDDFAFEDNTMAPDGLAPRQFPSFHAAAEEAGISRLYGGIHFRAAIEQGLAQGRCIGAHTIALTTRR